MEKKIIEILSETSPEHNFEHNQTEFIDHGIFDSFDIITLVSEFENHFEISIPGDQIIPENFNSLESMIKLVKKCKL